MDTNLIGYIENKFGPTSLESIFISDNTFNIPGRLNTMLNRTINYSFDTIDSYDMSHSFIRRIFNGDIHDESSCVKFTKSITVKVDADENYRYDKDKQIFVKRLVYPKNYNLTIKRLKKEVVDIIASFVGGDITPTNYNIIPTKSAHFDLNYKIGVVHIFQDDASENTITYYIAIPYSAECTNCQHIA